MNIASHTHHRSYLSCWSENWECIRLRPLVFIFLFFFFIFIYLYGRTSMKQRSLNLFYRDCILILLFLCGVTEVMSITSLVICGPSGVGKGSIIASLYRIFPEKISLAVSHTTRKPRPGKKDNILLQLPLNKLLSCIHHFSKW